MSNNWRALAEIIAAISIVVSLIFVGLEIRQSSSIARMEAFQSYSISIAENAREIVHDPQFAALLFEQTSGAKTEFTNQERAQLFVHYLSSLQLYHGLFQSVKEGVIPEEYLSIIADDPAFTSSFHISIWPALKVYLADEFVLWLESDVMGNQYL